jgi:hypothetical protein
LTVGAPFGPFLPVDLGNGVTLGYYEKRDEPIPPHHYAFLVPDEHFDAMTARLVAVGVSPTTPTPATPNPARSTASSADAAPISTTRAATAWRS